MYHCSMSNDNHYDNYADPITEMRRLSAIGQPFKLRFVKKNGQERIIRQAILRKQSLSRDDTRSAYKLQGIDQEHEAMFSCYIPLIKAFNDKPIILSNEQRT